MAKISALLVKELRGNTGSPMGDCKKALVECDGDIAKATEWLQKRTAAKVEKKAGRTAAEGLVQAYVHHDGRTGVICEVNSETDFVAKNADFGQFVRDLCMHIAAMSPTYVNRDEVPEEVVAKQREIAEAQVREMGKPEHLVPRIAEGKLKAWFSDNCLVDQPYVKDDKSRPVGTVLTELAGRIGEKLVIRRFVRFELGEGIEKKADDFADEVARMAAN
ncbi:MAG: translation elongation factor Ts [Myxococcales bacterium]|nr:translation elongation factor Ts [Myxococcales bacterium]